jgi:hypothetical protein
LPAAAQHRRHLFFPRTSLVTPLATPRACSAPNSRFCPPSPSSFSSAPEMAVSLRRRATRSALPFLARTTQTTGVVIPSEAVLWPTRDLLFRLLAILPNHATPAPRHPESAVADEGSLFARAFLGAHHVCSVEETQHQTVGERSALLLLHCRQHGSYGEERRDECDSFRMRNCFENTDSHHHG